MFAARKIMMCLVAVALPALAGSVAQAEVVVDHLYRMGEDDPGAVIGSETISPTKDRVGAIDLTKIGSGITYKSDTPQPGSTLSMGFASAGGYKTDRPFETRTANFGVELWVKPTELPTGGFRPLVLLHTGQNKMGLFLDLANKGRGTCKWRAKSDYRVSNSSAQVELLSPANAVLNTWTELAVVVKSDSAHPGKNMMTLYVNGVNVARQGDIEQGPGTGRLCIGYQISPFDTCSYFKGLMDHVRWFHFAEGGFDPSTDLMQTIPVPGASGGKEMRQ